MCVCVCLRRGLLRLLIGAFCDVWPTLLAEVAKPIAAKADLLKYLSLLPGTESYIGRIGEFGMSARMAQREYILDAHQFVHINPRHSADMRSSLFASSAGSSLANLASKRARQPSWCFL